MKKNRKHEEARRLDRLVDQLVAFDESPETGLAISFDSGSASRIVAMIRKSIQAKLDRSPTR